jgi:hypothetical protein
MMAAPTLHTVVEALGRLERRDLEEIALVYVRSHAQICRLASVTQHVEEQHASDAELAQRIGEMSLQQLAELLGPAAWLSVIAHEQRTSGPLRELGRCDRQGQSQRPVAMARPSPPSRIRARTVLPSSALRPPCNCGADVAVAG